MAKQENKRMDSFQKRITPGICAILGSGETTGTGRRVLSHLLPQLTEPRTIAVLDTPAGFQPNHRRVAEKIADFLTEKLAEFHPRPQVIETRRASLDTPEEIAALTAITNSTCIVAGPGSPTYMIRELQDTSYLDAVRQAHLRGAAIYASSAASIALSACSVPVYEVFKVGADPYWASGLNFFEPFGMKLAIVPHWNNNEGGAEVDTRFCYMGQVRFEKLQTLLPTDITILGIDEHTACIMNFVTANVSVEGKGSVHIVRDGYIIDILAGDTFPMSLLGTDSLESQQNLAHSIREMLTQTDILTGPATTLDPRIEEDAWANKIPPQLIDALLTIRSELRSTKQWALADKLRNAITDCGITIEDTPNGPRWHIADVEE
jgi:hypothetical protein